MCKDKWQHIYKLLDISIVERVGIRINLVKEMDEKEAKCFTKQFIDKGKVEGIGELLNSAVILNFKELDKCARVSISSGTIQSLAIKNNIQQQTITTKGVLIDIDYFVEHLKPENVTNQFEQGFDQFEKLLKNFD